jgi:hypothetical protein
MYTDTKTSKVYQEKLSDESTVLCRTENFVSTHEGFSSLLHNKTLMDILESLTGQEMILFKDKSVYSYPSSSTGMAKTTTGVWICLVIVVIFTFRRIPSREVYDPPLILTSL